MSGRLVRRAGALVLALLALGFLAHAGARWQPLSVADGATPTPTITPAPTITSISPAIGPFAGGTTLTITGTGFVAGASVTFDAVAGTSITVVSATKITVDTPAGTPGAPVIVVTNPNGQAATITAGYTYLGVPPTLVSANPATGSTNGATPVVLTGTAFASGMTVTVGGRSATSVTVTSATSATIVTPAGSAGAADIVVTNPDTQAATLVAGYTYNLAASPTVTAVTPASGTSAGKTSATITGTGFAAGATVTFGTSAATNVVVVNSTTIMATVPQGSVGTSVAVTVRNPDTQPGTRLNAYSYIHIDAPALTSLSITTWATWGGAPVTLVGTGFVSPVTVAFGSIAAAVTSVSSTAVVVTVPPTASITTGGVVSVTITNPDAQKSTLANAFTYVAPPAMTSVTPATVSTAGGSTITIAGTGFQDGVTVTINGTAATSVTRVSATQVTAVVPPGTAGTASVQIANPDGLYQALTTLLTYATGPSVTTISPSSGPPEGGTAVTITGTGFAAGDTVAFGGVAATNVTVVSATTITATTPAGTDAITAAVTVTATNSFVSNGDVTFVYLNPIPSFTLGTVPTTGIGFVSFSGGTDSQLVTAAHNAGCTATTLSFFALVNGAFITYIPAAPAVVNTAWDTHFGASIPEGTLLAVHCS
jgi:hypothetical protein